MTLGTTPGLGWRAPPPYAASVLRLAVVGLLLRVGIAVAIACLLAAMLALVREGSSFADGFRISVWLVGCVCVLLAFAGSSTTMRSGTVDPLAASFFPKLRPGMSEAASGTQVSSGALFVLTALVLFGLGVALG
jgi:hypothetical protein